MSNVLQNTGGNTLKVLGGGGFGSVGDAVATLPVANLVYDGFESGDWTTPSGPSPALNTNSFAWGSSSRVSIVNQAGTTGTVYADDAGPTGPTDYTGLVAGRWTGFENSKSARFRFPAPAVLGDEIVGEKYWAIPLGSGETDLWMRYQFRVPTNFYHDPALANNKFMALWSNGYSTTGTGCVWNMRPVSGNGSAQLMCSYALGNQIPSAGSSGEQPLGNFIDITTDQGLWFQMVLRFKAATADGANDGEIHTYYKKEGQSVFTEMTALTGLNTYIGAGLTGMRGGYIFGSHRGYAVDTEYLLDNFELSSSSLI